MDKKIVLKKVCVHNLQGVDLSLDTNQLIVFTGVSGSGKSSLAFDTLYVEGQRRYIESLSPFARRQLGEMAKPDFSVAEGISPTISIEQKTAGRNPRSTVGTLTEIYDYMRVLYARVAIPYCPVSGEPVSPQSAERIIKSVQALPSGTKIIILAPLAKEKKGEFKEEFADLLRKGFMRARIDGTIQTLTEDISLDGSLSHDIDLVIDRITVSSQNNSRIAEGITTALEMGKGVCSVLDVDTHDEHLFSKFAYSPKSGISYSSLEPHDFSFNSPSGMCPTCSGLGIIDTFDLAKIIDDNLSIAENCCSIASPYETVRYGNIYDNLADLYKFSVHTPWKKLSEAAKKVFLFGTEKKWTRMHFRHPVTGATWIDHVQWRGVVHEAKTRYAEAKSDSYRKKMQKLLISQQCTACHGTRLKAYPAAARLSGVKIGELTKMTIDQAAHFFNTLELSPKEQHIAEELLKEIRQRLKYLLEVGLHYLTLDRTAPTLSGGESQRVRLASQIGCGLVGITYILDEPSIGLHPRDNHKLIATLKHLRDMGNNVIVVEHDEETIWEADHIVDFGPGAGVRGGNIVADGDIKDLLKSQKSVTGAYLSGKRAINIPKKRRKHNGTSLEIKGAAHHNLKNIDVKIPLGLFVAITGVSGSGKSSLISDILFPALSNHLHGGEHTVGAHKSIEGISNIDKVIAIDQSPIGRNPRSNPATYIKLFDDIRNLFAELPESKARGYKPGRFSFNVKEGSCAQCGGMGMIKIDMDFMEDDWVECSLCHNKRFDPETLSVFFKEHNIHDILEMDVSNALKLFEHIPPLRHKLETLQKVGMEYIKLGQSSTTLSGGEAQRIKLAKELARPSTGNTLYILDEPTTGLHFHDISHLLEVLHALVEKGNSVVVIEHNMDVVKTADWIIDLGPEGGEGGGRLVAAGTPEAIAKGTTPTAIAVEEALHPNREEKIAEAIKRSEKIRRSKKSLQKSGIEDIVVTGAAQHNLKHIDAVIPRNQMTICTGPSGSGKTSLAFDTIYAEGQRRYIESLSAYARQFVKQMPKPIVTHVEGLSPAIAIEQKAHAGNPRSTAGTMTEIYDYLRILYARLGTPHCPETGEVIKAISKEHVVEKILQYPKGEKFQILAPVEIKATEDLKDVMARLLRQGFLRIRINGHYQQLDEPLDEKALSYDKKRKNEVLLVIDRLKVDIASKHRLLEAVENAAKIGKDKLIIARSSEDILFNLAFAVESTGKSYPEITPHSFAFNTIHGMCLDCLGIGSQYGANLMQKREVMQQSVASLIKVLWQDGFSYEAYAALKIILKAEKIDPEIPLHELTARQQNILIYGSGEDKWYDTSQGYRIRWVGINDVFTKAARSAHGFIREGIIPLLDEKPCASCHGARINPLARHVTLQGVPIHGLCNMPIERALPWVDSIPLSTQDKQLQEIKAQVVERLTFLCRVGLHYISLDRKAPTLSGGESQRIRLARQLGSSLTGVLYVLDEPTIGLHPRDSEMLLSALTQLKELGNTLLLVEHDPMMIANADYVLDFGPKAGIHGGHIVARGNVDQIKRNKNSLTGAYLSGKKVVPSPKKRRALNKGYLSIKKAQINNLKKIDVDIPIKTLTCLTGISGSGKSTLLHQVILPAVEKGLWTTPEINIEGATVSGIEHFNQVISLDQNPVGHTIRSDVCTYVDLLTHIRSFFASLPAARIRGLQPKHFSYNHRRGMCTSCWGLGFRKVQMQFLPPVKVTCEECKGMRLNPLSLEVTYAGKNLGEYLALTVDEARVAFDAHPSIVRILDTLISVGLGYLKLGQEIVSLSGGEAQRIRLSRELKRRSSGKTLYLFDEPTTGLHSDDIAKLLAVLHALVDKGNTVIVIEHNIDVMQNADFIIDLGPEAGEKGGEIVCLGTPEEVMEHPTSWTARALATNSKRV